MSHPTRVAHGQLIDTSSLSMGSAGADKTAAARRIRTAPVGMDDRHLSAGSLDTSEFGRLVRSRERDEVRKATEMALHALTSAEFGQALAHLMRATGRTQGAIVRHDAENGNWLTKSTVSRMVNGTSLCRESRQVGAFVDACDAAPYEQKWVYAWEQLQTRRAIQRYQRRTAATGTQDPV